MTKPGLHRDPEWLRRKYWDEGLSALEMGVLCGVHPDTVRWNMRYCGIPSRTLAEAAIVAIPKHTGKNNHFYGKKHTEHTKSLMSRPRKVKRKNLMIEDRIFRSIIFKSKRWHMTDETKRKLIDANTGRPGYWTGKTIPQKTRDKIAAKMSGRKSSTWNGGSSYLPYPPSWTSELKRLIRKRDGRCMICGTTERRLGVHHIDYDKNNTNPQNLLALCSVCHGWTNHNRNYWRCFCEKVVRQTKSTPAFQDDRLLREIGGTE